MQKNLLTTAILGGVALGLALPASANAATTISGEVSSISFRDTDPGLVVFASPIAFSDFTLHNIGDIASFDVLNIGTRETSALNGDDLTPYPISVAFDFDNAFGSPITGETYGFYFPVVCGIITGGCGGVSWDGPSIFEFGNGGKFSVELSDVAFGTPGQKKVNATFTLLSQSAAVPEPATWAMMLLGFGLVGGALRHRQRRQADVRFAF